jgi:glycolate oxidase iron-sulfur subunit
MEAKSIVDAHGVGSAVAAEAVIAPSGFSGEDQPAYDDYARCIHCGLCLNQCPTYRLWGREADSPRGRIRQMLLIGQGRLALNESFVTHIERCLDCRACETACPSGVEYGKLVELARAQIQQNYRGPLLPRLAAQFFYRQFLPHKRRIAALARLVRIYQRSGLQRAVRASGLLQILGLADAERLLPPIDSEFFYSRAGHTYPAHGKRRARVALFAGCVAQVTFAALNDATIRVLQANGAEVIVPRAQVCCGALAAHAGFRDMARQLARRNLDVFLGEPVDVIITNAAGCGSTLKEYGYLLEGDYAQAADASGAAGESETARAEIFSSRVRDISEFLCELGWNAPLRPLAASVTYQDSCHLLHGQKILSASRDLIRAIPGVELVEMPLASQCCGSAGVYNVTQPEASQALLKEKMESSRATGAQIIVTANPGCILQLRAGVAQYKTSQEVLHVVELLDRALA